MVFIGAALDDGASKLVAGPADIHGIFFLWMNVEPVTAIAAADGYPFKLDQALTVGRHWCVGFQELEVFWSGKSRSSHAGEYPLGFLF